MKYLNTYKLFESTEVGDEDVAELIEECKDIIETFNEAEDKFKVVYYETGFIQHNTFDSFKGSQSHESDSAAIKFYLALSSDISEDGRISGENKDPINIERVDSLIGLLTKSKQLIQRLSRYCEKIYYKLDGNSVKFILKFSNPDKKGSKRAKVQRFYKILDDAFKDYSVWKTLTLFQSFNVEKTPEKNKKLYELIKNNPKLIDGEYNNDKKWDESKSNGLELRFSCSESIDGDYIIVNVSGFKYRTYRMNKFKSIRLSNEEKLEAMKCIGQKISEIWNYYHRIDLNEIETSIDGDKIKIKIK